jgi:plasmid stability protein
MKNITITLPEECARWVRVRAAQEDRSVSRWLAELLEGMRRHEDEYDVAMKSFLSRKPRELHWIDGRRPTRDEIYDRPVLRWERKLAGDAASGSGTQRRQPTGDAKRG